MALYEIEPERGQRDGADTLRYQAPKPTRQARQSGELMHVKVRYKPPTEDASRLLEVPVRDGDMPVEDASENLRWASAVAKLGMLLRDSEHKGEASWEAASKLARGALGEDTGGERAELLYLLKAATKLQDAATTSRLR